MKVLLVFIIAGLLTGFIGILTSKFKESRESAGVVFIGSVFMLASWLFVDFCF